MPDIVNPQITDAVTQSNVNVLGDVPSVATGNLMQATAMALATMAQNAVAAQQAATTILQASTTSGVSLLYSQAGLEVGDDEK
jgi:hypothetical protein